MNYLADTHAVSTLTPLTDRRAISLVEMVIVISLTSILLGAVVTMFHSLNRWDQGVRDRNLARDQRVHLADVLRKDIRRAENVVLSENGALEMALPDGATTRYELMPDGCQRESSVAGEQQPRFEFFAIGGSKEFNLELKDVGDKKIAVVKIPLVDASSRPMSRPPLEVVALLGADLPNTAANTTGK